MAPLTLDSKLYNELSKQYQNNKDNITLKVYRDALETAKKYDKEEIQYILFKLRYINSDVNSGFDEINLSLNFGTRIFNVLTGRQYKLAFIYSILEAALND